MKTNKVTVQPMQPAFDREGSGYAITNPSSGHSFKNWSKVRKVFEGWDG